MKRFLFPLIFAVLITANCTKRIYVPVETVREVQVHDTTYLHKTDTLVKVPDVTIADYINLADTLRLEAPYATATSWVDSTLGILKGRLVQGGKLPMQIVEKERVVTKDSVVYEQVPYPVVEEKIVRKSPWYTRVLAWIGFAALMLLAGAIVYKFAKP